MPSSNLFQWLAVVRAVMIFRVKIKFEDFLGQVRYSKLHLSGLIGTKSHPDKHKIRIIGFFFENGLHWQFEVEKKSF